MTTISGTSLSSSEVGVVSNWGFRVQVIRFTGTIQTLLTRSIRGKFRSTEGVSGAETALSSRYISSRQFLDMSDDFVPTYPESDGTKGEQPFLDLLLVLREPMLIRMT